MVGLRGGRVEQGEQGVADELHDRAAVAEDARHRRRVEAVEHVDDLAGRDLLGERGEPAQVGEQGGDLGQRTAERGLVRVGQQALGDVGRHVGAEQGLQLRVQPGVLQRDGQLGGQRGREGGVVGGLADRDRQRARQVALHGQRVDHRAGHLHRGFPGSARPARRWSAPARPARRAGSARRRS